ECRPCVAPCPTTSPPTVDTSEPGSDDVPPSRKQRRGDATPCALARRRVAADQRSPMLVPAQRVALGSEGPPFLASRPIVHDLDPAGTSVTDHVRGPANDATSAQGEALRANEKLSRRQNRTLVLLLAIRRTVEMKLHGRRAARGHPQRIDDAVEVRRDELGGEEVPEQVVLRRGKGAPDQTVRVLREARQVVR